MVAFVLAGGGTTCTGSSDEHHQSRGRGGTLVVKSWSRAFMASKKYEPKEQVALANVARAPCTGPVARSLKQPVLKVQKSPICLDHRVGARSQSGQFLILTAEGIFSKIQLSTPMVQLTRTIVQRFSPNPGNCWLPSGPTNTRFIRTRSRSLSLSLTNYSCSLHATCLLTN